MKYMCLSVPEAHYILRLINSLAATCPEVHGIQCVYLDMYIGELDNRLNRGTPKSLHM